MQPTRQRPPTVSEVLGKNLPEKKFKAGAVEATIWANEFEKDGKKGIYKSISLSRNYKDRRTGDWKQTNSFRTNDLPKALLVLQKAYEHLSLNDTESIEEEDM